MLHLIASLLVANSLNNRGENPNFRVVFASFIHATLRLLDIALRLSDWGNVWVGTHVFETFVFATAG